MHPVLSFHGIIFASMFVFLVLVSALYFGTDCSQMNQNLVPPHLKKKIGKKSLIKQHKMQYKKIKYNQMT